MIIEILCPILCLLCVPPLCWALTEEQRLVQDIFSNYNPILRPVRRRNETLRIDLDIDIFFLLSVSEKYQTMEMEIWMSQWFTDELIGWDPEDYDNIDSITIPPQGRLWQSDVFLYNSVVLNSDNALPTNAVVKTQFVNRTEPGTNKQGYWVSSIYNWYPMIAKFMCAFNTQYFPFDVQHCYMRFGSWSFDMKHIDMYPRRSHIDISASDYVADEEWDLLSVEIKREELESSCCETYSVITVNLEMKRKASYYIVNLIIPTVVITEVAIVGFFTASTGEGERTEKTSLGIGTIMAMAVMIVMVGDSMPATSDYVPVIAWFFIAVTILIALGIATACFIMEVHRTGRLKKPIPKGIRSLFEKRLGRGIFFNIPKFSSNYEKGNIECKLFMLQVF